MAWAAPWTAVTGAIATASDQNISRDNLLYLKDHADNDVLHDVMTYAATSTSGYTVPAWGYHITVDATAGAKTVNLPTAVGSAGRAIEIRKGDSSTNTVVVDASGTQTINGALTFTLYNSGDSVTFRSDGTNVLVV